MPLDAPIPLGAGEPYQDLEQGVTAEGFPRLGSPDAPVAIEEFSSYACPHCRDLHDDQIPGLLDEVAAGDVQLIFVPIRHIGWGAADAARAALCAGEQGAFWSMHDVLFDWQARFVTSTFNPRRLVKGAGNLGLDPDAFERCLGSREVEDVLARAQREFERRGLSGTPTLFINGQRVQDYAELAELEMLADELRGN